MIKIKVIDLLVKIANGEEVPEKIRIGDGPDIFYYVEDIKSYKTKLNEYLMSDYLYNTMRLNKDIEIIEENKKIKELEHWVDVKSWVEGNDLEKGLEEQSEFNKNIYYKINEIIDYINKGE